MKGVMDQFQARFDDGLLIQKRSRAFRYSHAWRIHYRRVDGAVDSIHGFAISAPTARKRIEAEARTMKKTGFCKVIGEEIATVEPIN